MFASRHPKTRPGAGSSMASGSEPAGLLHDRYCAAVVVVVVTLPMVTPECAATDTPPSVEL
jgi:hypothetical protein